MYNENLKYLSDQLKYLGFGEGLQTELAKNLTEGKSEFQLHYQSQINKKPFEATLNFRKSDTSEMYFFNSYLASLERTNGQRFTQPFYIFKGKGVTGKEAFNLLDGRAVYKDLLTKEGQPYKAWIQLDFEKKNKHDHFELKHFHENYGYDLKAAVAKFPLAELKDPEKEKALLHSLSKGNLHLVKIENDGLIQNVYMEAAPQFKTVNIYDANLNIYEKNLLTADYSVGERVPSFNSPKDSDSDKKKVLEPPVKAILEKTPDKEKPSTLPKKKQNRR